MLISKNSSPFKIFLSHSSKDRGFSAEIYEHLLCLDVPVWFSPVEMPPTGIWYTDEEIETKLRQAMEICDSALILVDEYALNSRWVDYEIKIAGEIRHVKPDFKLVPIINDYPKTLLPDHIQILHPIDFNRGYKTALVNLLNRLEMARTDPFSIAIIGNAMARGSRLLKDGVALQNHLVKIGVSNEVRDMILDIRNYLAQFSYRPAIHEIMRWLSRWCSEHEQIDMLIEGNQWYSHIPSGGQYRIIFSGLPTSIVLDGDDDGMTPLALMLTLLYPGSDLDPSSATSILAQYGQDGSAYLWVVQMNSIYRYSMGSRKQESILLSENRMMGASRLALDLRNVSIDPTTQMLMQMVMNKIGKGMIQENNVQNPNSKEVGTISILWKRLREEQWEFPRTAQNSALWSHLTHGGVLIYEVSKQTGISRTMSEQIKSILKSAGAWIITSPIDRSTEINIAFSVLQSNDIANYLGISPSKLKTLANK
jgi:hypothetical protein